MRRIRFEELQNWLHDAETNPRRIARVNRAGWLWHIILAAVLGWIVYAIASNVLAAGVVAFFYFWFCKKISGFAAIPPWLLFLSIFVKKPDSCTITGH